jgi:protoporphyrinogen oxidase
MDRGQERIVILGGGVCGLYAGRRLAAAGHRVSIVEKESRFGGLASGMQIGRNFYDQGVHMLHEHDREIYEDCMAMMGKESVAVELNARIRWGGRFYRYPLQFTDMVKGMPPLMLGHAVVSLLLAQVRNKIAPWEPENCEEALIQLYGKALYHFFFEDFTYRYWGRHPSQISAMFVKRKMPRLTAVDALKRALGHFGVRERPGRAVESALLSETLHYSPTGAEALPRCIASQISKDGGRLFRESAVDEVKVKNGKIESVRIRHSRKGSCQTLLCSHVISTIPITGLLKALRPRVPQGITESCGHLRWLPIVVYGLLVKRERVMDALYTYYRERVFHRVGEPKNAGLKVEPHGHTVLIVEMTCQEGDEKWHGTQAMKQRVIADLESEGLCEGADVIEINILRNRHGYPVFSLGYEPHYEKVTGYLKGIDNLQSVGRQGGFSFPNMHSAMRMGADAAENIFLREGGCNE